MIMTRTEHDRAVVRVENTGPDVAEADIPALLEPFRRGRRAPGAAPVPGHGLGLAIVKAIITAHDGELDIAPRPGGGLRVTASLNRPE
jgi:signal transduction histidine kinase